jgi:hypothetical protein
MASRQRLSLPHTNARNRSTVAKWTGPAARILSSSPNATNGASCATRREAGVTGFDCGAGAVLLSVLSHRPGGFVPILVERAGYPLLRDLKWRDGKART